MTRTWIRRMLLGMVTRVGVSVVMSELSGLLHELVVKYPNSTYRHDVVGVSRFWQPFTDKEISRIDAMRGAGGRIHGHTLQKITDPARRTSGNYCPQCQDWMHP